MHNNADVASRMSRMNAILVVSGRVEMREEAGAAETAKIKATAIEEEEEVDFFRASIEALMVSTSNAREAKQGGIVLMVDPSSSSSSSSST